MDLDVASDVTRAGQEARVMGTRRKKPSSDLGHVVELPDLKRCPNGQRSAE